MGLPYVYTYIGVVWGVNVGIYSSPMECIWNWTLQSSNCDDHGPAVIKR